ncbi:beta-galactosidase 5-like [Andrographis paniculata]|uniref:beta-galactosidase 5-like n=1 Tax=Andrographis paniculata TaxID=175694 RepID=UPI0021E6F557|nr:beta-galactosidase 5-like [Andrographis paniculata]
MNQSKLFTGSAYGTRKKMAFTFTGPVDLQAGTNTISLLSVAMGLPNIGVHFENWNVGVGQVALYGLDRGKRDLSRQMWSYKVGLKGESLNLVSPDKVSSVEWTKVSAVAQTRQQMRWYKAYFDAPGGDEPLALDMGSMGKGQIWINGQTIGRYWTVYAQGNCSTCAYAGTYRTPTCEAGCSKPTQQWYHVPRSWLQPTRNLIVVLEELGGDTSRIALVKRTTTSICANAFEHHPSVANYKIDATGTQKMAHEARVHLRCAMGQAISAIKFASFGTPMGTCGSFKQGRCHAESSHAIVEKMCVGKKSCRIEVTNRYFGADPCPNVLKKLSVEAICLPQQ